MRCNVAMDQAPTAALDHHEYVVQPECGGDGNKEITGNDPLSMQTQERRLSQVPWRSAWWTTGQILPYSARRDLNPQFQDRLVVDAFLTPPGILIRHPAAQGANLHRNRRAAG
jgi:hypothetical protein